MNASMQFTANGYIGLLYYTLLIARYHTFTAAVPQLYKMYYVSSGCTEFNDV